MTEQEIENSYKDLKLFDLKDEKILYKIAEALNPRVVNETDNKIMIFCSCISKDLPQKYKKGMSIVVSSRSSAGKSTLVDTLLQVFDKDTRHFTQFTNAFFKRHFEGTGLDGIILHQEQEENTNKYGQMKFSIPKFQLSEGKTIVGLVDRNEKDQNESKLIGTYGFPIFITTTVNPDIEEQDKNRVILLQSDESNQQTKAIKDFIANQYSHENDDKIWNYNIEQLRILTSIYKYETKFLRKIKVPFAKKLQNVVDESLEIRRDFPKILNSICINAFIHHKNRKKVRFIENTFTDQYANTEKKYYYDIIANLRDFGDVCEYGNTAFMQTLNKVNESTEKIVQCVISIDNQHKDEPDFVGVNALDVCEAMQIKQNYANELLRQGRTAGYFNVKKIGKENYYRPTNKTFSRLSSDDIEFTEKEFTEWLDIEYPDKNKFELI